MTNEQKVDVEKKEYVYDEAFELTKEEVDRILSASPLIIREYTSHLNKTTGKFIRAGSLLACGLNERDRVEENAVKLAAALEILHLATLVHDDVIDDADLRRGSVTLQRKYGTRTAVICGDYLMSRALRLVSSVSEKEEYPEMKIPDFLGRVCLGELNQHINSGNYDLTTFQYLKIISGKTAALFEAAFFTGACLVEKESEVAGKYAKIGRYTGMIFQLTDDCMDFSSSEDEAGKTVQSDYEQDVITLPLIHAFRKFAHLKEKAKNYSLSRREINEAVRESGGLEHAGELADKYREKAFSVLKELEMSSLKRSVITSILDRACRLS